MRIAMIPALYLEKKNSGTQKGQVICQGTWLAKGGAVPNPQFPDSKHRPYSSCYIVLQVISLTVIILPARLVFVCF